MKAKSIQSLTGLFFLIGFAPALLAQTDSRVVKDSTKLEEKKVPVAVSKNFYIQHPLKFSPKWYSYPAFDHPKKWYEDYPYGYAENPDYYAAEFTKDHITYRSIYTKSGDKVATHKILAAGLPQPILKAISEGKYKAWQITADKEEIFRDTDSDKLKVYRVKVSNGKQIRNLYFQPNGMLLKDMRVD